MTDENQITQINSNNPPKLWHPQNAIQKFGNFNGLAAESTIYCRKNAQFLQKKRAAVILDQYFCNYYSDLFKYIDRREKALAELVQKYKDNELSVLLEFKKEDFLMKERKLLRQRRWKPQLKDFSIVTQIGQGAFGEIYLAQRLKTKEVCALKMIPKKFASHSYQRLSILTERDILATARYEYLVHLKYAFQDCNNLYLAMEFLPGGDFRTFLNNNQSLDGNAVKFYFAEMVMAVGSVHEMGYIHRDIKPENFLITSKGHIKLTDFGLACGVLSGQIVNSKRDKYSGYMGEVSNGGVDICKKYMYDKTGESPVWAKETVGSLDYMAVEVLERRPYNKTVDFWSLGCVLYEMVTFKTPFQGSHEAIMKWKTRFGSKSMGNEHGLDKDTWGMVTRLIADPINRFQNAEEILVDRYFPEKELLAEMIKTAPFSPVLESEQDCKYFDDFNSAEIQTLYYEIIMHRRKVEEKLEKERLDKYFDEGYKKKSEYPMFTFKRQKGWKY